MRVGVLALVVGAWGCNAFLDLDQFTTGGGSEDAGPVSSGDAATPPNDSSSEQVTTIPESGSPDAGDGSVPGSGCMGSEGPTPVAIELGNVRFCMDSTEVTNAQYAKFLATNP